jgi:predicted Zn finger-like uncharacterized protein
MSKATRAALLSLALALASEVVCPAADWLSDPDKVQETTMIFDKIFWSVLLIAFAAVVVQKTLAYSADCWRSLKIGKLKTRCPHCGTTYYVRKRQLNGETTCAKCGKVFKIKEAITLKQV